MSAYFSKSELEPSQALLPVCRELRSISLNTREAMHKLASTYSTSRQIFLREAVYYSLPELWLRNCFPRTAFDSTSIPSKCIRICKSMEAIENLKSTDIFKRNMVDRYIGRSNRQYKNGMYDIVGHMCVAMFAAPYYLDYENKDENDSQMF